jgi:cytochrome b6-f complex iron-sulfur subunit
LGKAAFWTAAGTLGFAALGISRMPMPGVFPGQSSQLKIGVPGEYPVSNEPIRVPGQNLYVLHDPEGYAVIGAICTHLGCVVALSSDGFHCPCHGSQFALDGKVVKGPAPSPLAWYEVSLPRMARCLWTPRRRSRSARRLRFEELIRRGGPVSRDGWHGLC